MLEQYLGLNGYLGSTDRAVLLANGTGGLTAQASSLTLSANNCLTIPGSTLTASEPLLNLSQIWNNAGVAFTGIKFNATDTASASGSLLADFQVGGSSKLSIGKDGRLNLAPTAAPNYNAYITNIGPGIELFVAGVGSLYSTQGGACIIPSNGRFSWSNSTAPTSIEDVALYRDAANTLALRNGVNAQALNIYNTWGNSGTDYERLNISYSGNVAYIQTMNGGTGSARQLIIGTKTASNLTFCTNDNNRWGVQATTGAWYANSDNSYDIGMNASSNRPRTGYFGTGLDIGNGLVALNTQTVGTPSFNSGRLQLKESEQSGVAELEIVEDPSNASTVALRIVPPVNNTRFHFGKSGKAFYSLNLQYVSGIENMPSFSAGSSAIIIGGVGSNAFYRNLDYGLIFNSAAGSSGYCFQWYGDSAGFNNVGSGAKLFLALDRDKTKGLQLYNTDTGYSNASQPTNRELLAFRWNSNVAIIETQKAGTGVARDLVLGADSAELVRFQTGSKIGFFGVTPVARPAAYTVTNGATDRAYDAAATTVAELANVLGTLISDLRTLGLVA